MKKSYSFSLKILLFVFFAVIQLQSTYGQKNDVYLLTEYIESEEVSYVFQASCNKDTDGKYNEVFLYVTCHPGKKKEYDIKKHNGAFGVFLDVVDVEKKKMNFYQSTTKGQDKERDPYSYILKTKFKKLSTEVDQNSCKGLGLLQLKTGLISQVTVYENTLLATIGKKDLLFKRYYEAKENNVTKTKSKGEEYLDSYGEMDFLFYERDAKDKQLNQIIATVKRDETGQYVVRVHFNVWDAPRKKKVGEMLGAYTMHYIVENIKLSDNSDNPIVYLDCKEPKWGKDKLVNFEFKGYYWPIWNALNNNRKWTMMPGGSISFYTGKNDFYISAANGHDGLKYKR